MPFFFFFLNTHALPKLMDTHINIIPLSCPSHNSPIGPCHRERDEKDREVWKCCLDPTILPTVKSYVSVCVCVGRILSPSLSAYTNCLPSCLSVCARACILTESSFARKMSLQRPAACRHSSPRCQNVVSSKQSDDILSDSDRPHRFTPDRADSSGLVIQTESSSRLRNKNNRHISMIVGHQVKKKSNISEKVKSCLHALCTYTVLLHMTGYYQQWWLTWIEMSFLVSQRCNTQHDKAAQGLI